MSTGTFFNTPRGAGGLFANAAAPPTGVGSLTGTGAAPSQVTTYAIGSTASLLAAPASGSLGLKIFEIHLSYYFPGSGGVYNSGSPAPTMGCLYLCISTIQTGGLISEMIQFGPELMNDCGKRIIRYDGSDPRRSSNFVIPPSENLVGMAIMTGPDFLVVTVQCADAMP